MCDKCNINIKRLQTLKSHFYNSDKITFEQVSITPALFTVCLLLPSSPAIFQFHFFLLLPASPSLIGHSYFFVGPNYVPVLSCFCA